MSKQNQVGAINQLSVAPNHSSKLPSNYVHTSPLSTFHSLDPFFIGFENLFDELTNFSSLKPNLQYPPYSIRKLNDVNYYIEIALAGFSKDDINVSIEDSKLVVSGDKKEEDTSNYIHKGISYKKFRREFVLPDTMEIVTAKMENGMLIIDLKNNIPESKIPRKIDIN